ncbi:alpha/beta hydrolase family protein [Solimicrobium silvestre]|uniref:Alpha/beta hydrolase family n=1 Tax=Solimicrobium silvestre TaxID=2099400 RepID=A0A2S9H2W1_9BURK|nr:alpha/beta fold hydrolase [Solimicrobium silvestre]PRC94308.1 Alpha/beta hydrolase family [Solimicrobium silvestre]
MLKKKMNVAVASIKILAGAAFAFLASAAVAGSSDIKIEPKADTHSIAQEIEGNWGGTLAGTLRLILHVKKSPSGEYTAVMESVDQGNAMIPVDKLEVTADHLILSATTVHGSFDAKWDDKAKAWAGTWTQGQGMPLTLSRTNGDIPRPRRPQEHAIETAPLPYGQQAVTFDGGNANVKLAGTFSTPKGEGPFPAVVLIAGSGPNTRDEGVAGHKVFLVLSDYLTKRGIAVLRYDKRGVDQSTGDYKSATTAEFTSDAEAAFTYLRSRADVDVRHIGLIGHSEGGEIVPAVAANDAKVSFIVLLAGPAIRGDKLLAEQIYLIDKASGVPEDHGTISRKINEEIFTAIAEAANESEAKLKAEAIFDKAVEDHKIFGDVAQTKAAGFSQLSTPWMRYFLSYDPVPALRQVKVPVLALNGSLDLQVPPKDDLAAMRDALSNNKDVTVMELANLNHLFQAASTGSPTEYAVIEETINPIALNVIGDWVSAHTK